ncbi:MAG: hypothetical protein KatS3mg077_2875 [Candidatus Binatia bacterium]|nr:MAG: hypothetical protein KatS3mg077_2875 [Candidatus Binatia bacterium]
MQTVRGALIAATLSLVACAPGPARYAGARLANAQGEGGGVNPGLKKNRGVNSERSPSMTKEQVIALARAAARRKGYETDDLEVDVQLVGETWQVSFFKSTPGTLGGGGFMVRLREPSGEFVDLRHFQ